MKLPVYREIITKGEKAIKKGLAPIRAKRAKKQAELEMCKIEEEIATKETSLHEECSKEDVKFSKIIETQDALGLLERRQAQYGKILEEMFPE